MKIRSEEIKSRRDNNKVVSLEQHRQAKVSPKRAENKPETRTNAPTKRRDESVISREAKTSNDGDGLFSGIVDNIKDAFGFGKETKRAEGKDENATIAVFDSFNDADKPGESTHGEQVEGIIQQEGGFKDEDIQRYQINSGGSRAELEKQLAEGDDDALSNYVEDRYTSMLDNTSDGIEEILDDKDSKIKTINQSQSVAEGRIVRDLWKDAKNDPKFRESLAEHLGFDSNVSDRELAQALVDDVGDIVNSSDAIAESKDRFNKVSKRATDAGITHVVTSGNLGDFAGELDRLGVETDKQFYDSAFVNGHTLVVGASDETGKRSTSADFNSPNANADVSAPGVDISLTTQDGAKEKNSGTSFAAPAVAALVAQIKAENPGITPREIELLLERTADPVLGPKNEVGSGTINAEEALAAA